MKKDPHIYYHPFIKFVEDRFGKTPTGIEAIEAIEKYASKHPEIKISTCDDSMFSGSILVLIPHPKMGISVMFVPQLTNTTNNFFLYGGHMNDLLRALEAASKVVSGETKT